MCSVTFICHSEERSKLFLFFKYFNFSQEVYKQANDFIKQFENKKILGLHFRGTDKLRVKWVNHLTIEHFLTILDYHLSLNHYDGIFFQPIVYYFILN